MQSAHSDTVTPVSVLTGRRGRSVRVPDFPTGIAISPNGATVYVTCLRGVLPISAASGDAGKLIKIRPSPSYIIVAPDGKTVYIAAGDSVVPIDARTGRVGRATKVAANGDGPEELAVSPDSKTVYALNQASVVPVSAITGRAGKAVYVGAVGTTMVFTPNGATGFLLGIPNDVVPIHVRTEAPGMPIRVGPLTADSRTIAVTPNGKTIYVANEGSGTVVPISTANGTAGKPIKVGYEPAFIAITPDGKTAYVATTDGIYPIRTMSNTVGRRVKIESFVPEAIAITPDGRTVWASGLRPPTGVVVGDRGYLVSNSTATDKPGRLIEIGRDPSCLVVRPWRSGAALGPTSCDP